MDPTKIIAVILMVLIAGMVVTAVDVSKAAGTNDVNIRYATINVGNMTTVTMSADSPNGGMDSYDPTVAIHPSIAKITTIDRKNYSLRGDSPIITDDKSLTDFWDAVADTADTADTGRHSIAAGIRKSLATGSESLDLEVKTVDEENRIVDDIGAGNDSVLTVEAVATQTPTPTPDLPGTADAQLKDNGTFWQGQRLVYEANVERNEMFELRRQTEEGKAGALVRQVRANSDGQVFIDTEDLDGKFILEDGDNNPVASFEVVIQTLDVTWSSGSVARTGDETTTDLEFDSNRAVFDVDISAKGLDQDALLRIFSNATALKDDTIQITDVVDRKAITADFDRVDAGTYNITVEVNDTTAQDTEPIRVLSLDTITANVTNRTIQQERGDVLNIPVNLQHTDSATMWIGSKDANYLVELKITDGNTNGEVIVKMDTFRAGRASDESTVYSTDDPEDSVSVNRLTAQLADPLESDDYKINVTVSGERKDIGLIRIQERSTGALSVHTAPGTESLTSLQKMKDVMTGHDAAKEIAKGDWLILHGEVSGLYAYLKNENPKTLARNGLSLEIKQISSDPGQSKKTIDAREKLFTDPTNDEFWVATKLTQDNLESGDAFVVDFTITEANPLVSDKEATVTSFKLVDDEANIDLTTESAVIVPASTNAQVTGTSSLSPGTELMVSVRNTSSENPFRRQAQPEVRSDGTWSASFDLSEIPDTTVFTVEVSKGATTYDTADGKIKLSPTPVMKTTVIKRTVIRNSTVVKQPPSPTPKEITRIVTKTTIVHRTVLKKSTPTPGQPGFGIAIAVVALIAAVLIAIRRDRH